MGPASGIPFYQPQFFQKSETAQILESLIRYLPLVISAGKTDTCQGLRNGYDPLYGRGPGAALGFLCGLIGLGGKGILVSFWRCQTCACGSGIFSCPYFPGSSQSGNKTTGSGLGFSGVPLPKSLRFQKFYSLCILYSILYAHLVSHLLFLIQNLFQLKKWLEGLFGITEKHLHSIFELFTLNNIYSQLLDCKKIPVLV